MQKKYLYITCSLFVLFWSICTIAQAASPQNEYIIKYSKPQIQALQSSSAELSLYSEQDIKKAIASMLGFIPRKTFTNLDSQIVTINPQSDISLDLVLQLKEEGYIESIESNQLKAISSTPNDARFQELWGLNNSNDTDIDAPEAWDIIDSATTEDVVVAVLDTGIDLTHPDLVNNLWINPNEIANNGLDDDNDGIIDDIYGVNVVSSSGNPQDDEGHGSHCAGTIAASGNNSIGVIGVNPRAKLMAVKFLDSMGYGYTSTLLQGYDYILEQKKRGINIKVVNASFGGNGYSEAEWQAIDALREQGITLVAAAGNESTDNDITPSYPANYSLDNIVSVGAISKDGSLSDFSNYGISSVDVAAPGKDILSTTTNNSYEKKSGTSMAAPHVTGTVSLISSIHPELTPDQIRQMLISSCKALSSLSSSIKCGGTISAQKVLQTTPPAPSSNTVPVIATIPNQIMGVDDIRYITLNVSDSDGDELHRWVVVEDSSLISVQLEGSLLLITSNSENFGQTTVTVKAADGKSRATQSFVVEVSPTAISIDSDGDGVSDGKEYKVGTDPYDAGSFQRPFGGSGFVPWNKTSNEVLNLEVSNASDTKASVRVEMWSSAGKLLSHNQYEVLALKQLIVQLNQLPGFQKAEAGFVRVISSGDIGGQLVVSSRSDSSVAGEMYALPIAEAKTSSSYLPFNLQNGNISTQSTILNSLSLINTSKAKQDFKLVIYNNKGKRISTRTQTIGARARYDVALDEVFVKSALFGTLQIIPLNATTSYTAFVKRSYQLGSGDIKTLPFISHIGRGTDQYVALTSGENKKTSLELVNTSSSPIKVRLRLFDFFGWATKTDAAWYTVPAKGVRIVDLTKYNNNLVLGYVRIRTDKKESLVAHQIDYYYSSNSQFNSALSFYPREVGKTRQVGVFNINEDLNNWLTLTNVGSEETSVTVTLKTSKGSSKITSLLFPNMTKRIAIHDSSMLAAKQVSIGTVVVDAGSSHSIVTELSRISTSNYKDVAFGISSELH